MLLCILVIGVASAISVKPAAVQAVKMSAPANQATVIQYHAVPVTMIAPEGRIIVIINSVPAGADVRIDGTPGPQETTPCTTTLPAGTHTIIIAKSGYRDNTTRITLKTGMATQHVSVNLERLISPELARVMLTGTQVSGVGTTAVPSPSLTLLPGAAAPTVQRINKTTTLVAMSVIPVAPVQLRRAAVLPQQALITGFLDFIGGIFHPVTCPAGKTNCHGRCVDINFDAQNCGYCDGTCFDPAVCCNGECVDITWDSENCGSCGMSCFMPATCCFGSCENTCPGKPAPMELVTQKGEQVLVTQTAEQVLAAPSPWAAAGYTCRKDDTAYYASSIAENLYATSRYSAILFMNGRAISYNWNTGEKIAQMTVTGWMNSTGHRENILDRNLQREGIGVAIGEDDLVYITEDLCW
jgi:PEGA domain/Stigma-specific protein, Stig1/Cysteine-rich secretory protein family